MTTEAAHKSVTAANTSARTVSWPSLIVENAYAMYFPMHTFCAPMAPPINGLPICSIHSGKVTYSRASAHSMNASQLATIYKHDVDLSISCGGVRFEASSGVTEMANMHPNII